MPTQIIQKGENPVTRKRGHVLKKADGDYAVFLQRKPMKRRDMISVHPDSLTARMALAHALRSRY